MIGKNIEFYEGVNKINLHILNLLFSWYQDNYSEIVENEKRQS